MTTMSGVFLVLILSVTLACGGSKVTSDDLGGNWSLTVEEVELFCAEDAVWLKAEDRFYALNGWAQVYLPEKRPWIEPLYNVSDIQRSGRSVGPLIERALNLC